MSKKIDLKNIYLQEFDKLKAKLNGSRSSELFKKRQEAHEKFAELGFPTRKHEQWRFTNIAFLNRNEFLPVSEADDSGLKSEDFEKYFLKGKNKYRLVFVDGFFSKELSKVNHDKGSIITGSMETLLSQNFEPAVENFGTITDSENEAFAALNTSLALDGAFIYIPAGIAEEEPVQVLFISGGSDKQPLVQPRNLIIAGENSIAKIVFRYITVGENDAFVNMVTEGIVNENANLELYSIHDDEKSYYIHSTDFVQKERSVFHDYKVNLKGPFVRNNLNTKLDGQHCEANYYGLYYLENNDFADNHTIVDHALPNSHSSEFYKGILDGKASSVFSGKILVRPDAQKTNAFQSNKNVLLTPDVKIHTKPQLEIFADDVKCSHGATSGALDESAMFYLQSRGISRKDAKSMLVLAFANDLLENIKIEELRLEIKEIIAARLGINYEEIEV